MKGGVFKLFVWIVLIVGYLSASSVDGRWIKERGISDLTRLHVTHGMAIIFGECKGGECEWGRSRFLLINNGIFATFKRGRMFIALVAQRVNPNRIKVFIKFLNRTNGKEKTRIIYMKKERRVINLNYSGVWVPKRKIGAYQTSKIVIKKEENKWRVDIYMRCRDNRDCGKKSIVAYKKDGKLIGVLNRRLARERIVITPISYDIANNEVTRAHVLFTKRYRNRKTLRDSFEIIKVY